MWEELYEAHYSELVRYGTSMCGSKEAAEDLVQETFVRAMMHCDLVADLSSGKRRAWLYRTMKNLYFDRCRRAALECRLTRSAPPEPLDDPGLQEVEIAMLLQSIRPEDRALLQLRYFDGYTASELSQLLGLPPGTVRSKLSRCRKQLKDTL